MKGLVIVTRCHECSSCQEWLLDPDSAPQCWRLQLRLPDGTCQQHGTERRLYRAVERWFRDVSPAGLSFNACSFDWREGTCPPPALRQNQRNLCAVEHLAARRRPR